jgi:hypothetical protein
LFWLAGKRGGGGSGVSVRRSFDGVVEVRSSGRLLILAPPTQAACRRLARRLHRPDAASLRLLLHGPDVAWGLRSWARDCGLDCGAPTSSPDVFLEHLTHSIVSGAVVAIVLPDPHRPSPPPISTSSRAPPSPPNAQGQSVRGLSFRQRLVIVFWRAIEGPRLGAEAKQALLNLISPANIETTMLWIAAVGAAHMVGIGEIADVALIGLAYLTGGMAAIQGLEELYASVKLMQSAEDDAALTRAADLLAQAMLSLGAGALLVILARAGRARGGSASEAEPGSKMFKMERKAPVAPEAPRLAPAPKPPVITQIAKPTSPPSFGTAPGEAHFWSGLGPGGANAAAEIAGSGGGTTLEMFIEARGIEMPVWDASNPASVQAWEDASKAFASGASGDVRAVVGSNVRPGSIWQKVELPALQDNPNVTKIIGVDPVTKAETVLWAK